MDEQSKEASILAKWLAGELSEAELAKLQKEFDLPLLEKIVRATDELEFDVYDGNASWQKLKEKKDRLRQLRRRQRRKYLIAAAIAFVASLSVWLWLDQPVDHMVVRAGEQKQYTLPDGSTVFLNAGSELQLALGNWDSNRSMTMSGEGFFEVTPGRTFTVRASLGEIEVLGTSFNVLSRSSDQFFVRCYSGRVIVRYGTVQVVLEAGGMASLNAQGQLIDERFELESSGRSSWIDGLSKFNDATLGDVFAELERQYDITIHGAGLATRRYGGAFVHDDLAKALKMVCEPMNLRFSYINEKEIEISE